MRNRLVVMGLAVAVVALCVLTIGCGGGGGGATSATGSIEGQVYVPDDTRATDAPTGYAPLASATVEVTSGGRAFQAATDSFGHFRVDGVPTGAASVRVTPPAGKAYRTLNTSVNVAGGSTAMIGEQGRVSLLSSAAAGLETSIQEIDLSAWPIVTVHVDVNDPNAQVRVMGLQASDFNINLNGTEAAVEQVRIQDRYVLTVRIRDASAQQCQVHLSSSFCDRNGSASLAAAREANSFISPVGGSAGAGFKDPAYATQHPGMWHMGVDYNAQAGAPVYAVASGEVLRRVITGSVTGLVIRHRTAENLQTASETTNQFYAVYGYINATVSNGSTVEAGQQIGTVAQWAQGNHLHFGIRVGQDITGEWRMSNCPGGQTPSADANGWTNGWADPDTFLDTYTPDNSIL